MTETHLNSESISTLDTVAAVAPEQQMEVEAEESNAASETSEQSTVTEENEGEESEESADDPIHTPQRVRRAPEQPPPVIRRLFCSTTDMEKELLEVYLADLQLLWQQFKATGFHLVLLGMLLVNAWPRSVHLVLGLLLMGLSGSAIGRNLKEHLNFAIHADTAEAVGLLLTHVAFFGLGYIFIRAV